MRLRIVLLALGLVGVVPDAASAAPGVCTYDAGTQIATYEWPSTYATSEVPGVQRFGAGNAQITVGYAPDGACGAATVTNTKEVRIVGTPPASTSTRDDFSIALKNGVMAPGSGGTGEVKVTFVSPGRTIYVRVGGSPDPDRITVGAAGVNLNADEATDDVDVTLTGSGGMLVTGRGCTDSICNADGSAGDDTLKTTGGDATGAAAPGSFARSTRVFGGPGADTITVSRYTSVFPGPDSDVITGPGVQPDRFQAATLDYRGTPAGVVVDLDAGTATGGSGSDTVSGVQNVVGTSFPDTLLGDGNANSLSSEGAGADLMRGRGGNDSLAGGSGADTLEGGPDADDLTGNAGGDTLSGEEGNDTLTGDVGTGSAGNDTLLGGPGNDGLVPATGDDIVDGGPDKDELRFAYVTATPVVFDLAVTAKQNTGGGGLKTVTNVEDISGSSQSDTLSGDDGPNAINGGFGGNDTLDGRGGNDAVRKFSTAAGLARGGPGADTVSGSDGADVLEGGPGPDTILALKGDDTLRGPADGEKDTLYCGEGTDTTEHDAGLDVLSECENGTGTVFVPPPIVTPDPAPEVSAPAPAPQTPVVPAAATPAAAPLPAIPAAQAIKLPAATSCASRRTLTINLVQPAGVTFTRAKVTLKAGKKTINRTLTPKKAGKGLKIDVDLRGLPKGRFTVAIEVAAADGRTVKASRAYRTCTPKKRR